MTDIHKWSDIAEGAQIGNGTKIDAFTVIEDDVIIGENCHIMPHATIMSGTRMGDGCKVFPGAVVGAIPQDLKYEGEYATLEIGNNVTIREYVTLNIGTKANEKTVVGNNVLLMAYVHVAHDCIIDDHVILVNGVNLAGHVEIGEYAILGGLSAVQQFVRIGKHAMIGGGSLVRKDVPPYIKAAREPLSYIGVNTIGLKRRGYAEDDMREIQDIYREIFVKNSVLQQGVTEVKASYAQSAYGKEIVDFIEDSKGGVLKSFQS